MSRVCFQAVLSLAVFFTCIQATIAATENELRCGSLQNAYGPFDYRTAPPEKRQLVEGAHFTNEVEQLIRGKTSTEPTGDLDYTLRVFPNHTRALRSMMDYGNRKKTERLSGAKWPVWCYFDRAIRFQPDDSQVRVLYGVYLQRKGDYRQALQQLAEAERLAAENINVLYNIGLVYVDLGQYDKALEYAHRAYGAGHPLEGLKNRLKRANKWRDPLRTKDSEASSTHQEPTASIESESGNK